MYFVSKKIKNNHSLCLFYVFPSPPSIHDEVRHQNPSSPVKESNLKEENCRKNYFPVPWRVIGGGVRVGITETEDSDLYSIANTLRPVNPVSTLENDSPTKIVSRKRSNSNPPTPTHSLQFKVEHVCPFSHHSFVNFTNFHARITQLFSAESPGVL